MLEDIQRFGGAGETLLNPVGALLLIAASLLMLFLPRKYVIVPFFVTTFLLPMAQTVVIAGIHFMTFRILILFGWLRVIGSQLSAVRESQRFRMNSIDKTLILWTLSSVVTFSVLWGEWAAFINRMGLLYNAFGVYFLLRFLYRDEEDVDRTIRVFAIICAFVAGCMLNEHITRRNLFWVFGGVPEFTLVREGALRAQGAFAHPILAGTFGATLLPLFVGLWWQGSKLRTTALVGMISATIITITSMSSTPLLAYLAGVVGLCFWVFRKQMRLVRWGLASLVIGLHLVMKAPVWALIARVEVIGGSSGDHRYQLVNQFIGHFEEWWLLGSKHPAQWGYFMGDTSNQYVNTGVTGGLITLILFLAIIVSCFKCLGTARKTSEGNPTAERRLWALGAALFSNLVAFFGIVYFDQMIVSWFALLAMISVAAFSGACSHETATANVGIPGAGRPRSLQPTC